MKVTFLGTCGYGETATRNTVSILLDNHLLVDAGEGVTQRLLQRNITGHITDIFLTHGHMDHVIGIFPLLWQYIVVEQRTAPLHIVCPTYVKNAIEQMLDLTYFPLGTQKFSLKFTTLDLASEREFHVAIPKYQIEAIVLEHQPSSVGYRFTTSGSAIKQNVFAFTGDTGPSPNISKLGAKADLLVTECTFPTELADLAHKLHHLTPFDAATAAKSAASLRLGLIHTPNYILEHRKDVLKEIGSVFSSRDIIFCEDNAEITL